MYPKNKWKHILPLLLVLFLVLSPVATAQDILIPETQPTKAPDDFTDHQTVEVTGGFIAYSLKGATATLFYPLEKQVLCQDDGVLFQKYSVEEGDTVKKGDLVAYVYRPGNQTELARLKLNLQRAEESMREGISQRQESIAHLQAQLVQQTDAREREILRLTIEYQKADLELYKYEQQQSIDSRKESLARYDPLPVYANMDGTIMTLRADPEDALSSGDVLLTIRDENVRYLRMKSGASDLTYNLPLTLTPSAAGKDEQEGSVPPVAGRVIAAGNVVPDSLPALFYGDAAYLIPEPGQTLPEASVYRIEGDLRRIDDVLILPEEALTELNNHMAYATVLLPDGSTETRPVTLGVSEAFYNYTTFNGITRYFWILDGLAEGETVILWE
jgi:multidrug efflux pump subunit AcrA (membrane-fusion protein)